MRSTSVRVDVETHQELKKLAAHRGTTVGETVKVAVRRMRQDLIGEQLRGGLSEAESAWLDADLR